MWGSGHTRVMLDTLDSQEPHTPYSTHWTINEWYYAQLKTYQVQLASIAIPHAVLPTNRFNNRVYWQEAGSTAVTYEAIIPVGYYTDAATYLGALASVMTVASGNLYTFTGSFDSLTYRATVDAGAGNTFRFVEGDWSAYGQLGVQEGGNFAQTQIGVSPMDLSGTKYLDIVTNLPTQSYNSRDTLNYGISRVHLHDVFGTMIFHTFDSDSYINVEGHGFTRFDLYLFDDEGNPFELPPGQHVSIELRILPVE